MTMRVGFAGLGHMDLALGIAAGAGLPLPVTTAARRFLDQACAEGFADADFACVAALVRGGAC